MVYILGILSEAHSVNPVQLVEMFESSWRVRNIWDGVKLEVVEDRSPVVLHSFTHLDPDLPLLEVRRCSDGGQIGLMAHRGEGTEVDCCSSRVGIFLDDCSGKYPIFIHVHPFVASFSSRTNMFSN